ncbi:hypothetical protein CKY04_20520 [Photorhabdus sp. S8-52]|nr:hypothetical protein CKY03_20840 [Photorhabdus sp. S9-53]RAW94229.1 hypothetical protein CKY05_20625 [Photorhabdus sp. S10-54]RAW97895.1 hypothetical protein CKY04_20520 [Photorhabdus sp. S8-52]
MSKSGDNKSHIWKIISKHFWVPKRHKNRLFSFMGVGFAEMAISKCNLRHFNAVPRVVIYLFPLGIICIPVIFQVASLLAALTHPGHIVIYAPGDSLPCRRDAS